MANCTACGAENAASALFCAQCGTRLSTGATSPTPETRRTVTVLFSDIVGSTSLGEALDPETLRAVMDRYFSAMERNITAHGGRVEKFIGDAIMAVFGLPKLHEDDAVRAVRAADAMRGELASLNVALADDVGVTIAARTGINTGEVVAGSLEGARTLVTGDTVNTAARLEQAAESGTILIGETTEQLVRGEATLHAVGPIVAKGKANAVRAFRVVSVSPQPGASPRVSSSPFVARDNELSQLQRVFADVARERTPATVTVLGPAGVGKSRLVAEFTAQLEADGRARILRGRCLSYGEGLTYWPLRQIVLSAADATGEESAPHAVRKVQTITGRTRDGLLIADRLATAIGLIEGTIDPDEILWAARRTIESLAGQKPLVLIVEDIHWARPPLLELLSHLNDQAEAAVLIICPARSELFESAPNWGKGPRSSAIALEGLPEEAGGSLIDATAGNAQLPAELRERILDTAEGNPLFVEEMVRLVLESGDTSMPMPPTIDALMSSRVDQLPRAERAVAQRGAIVGRAFERPSVEALLSAEARPTIEENLAGLVRRDLLLRDNAGPAMNAYKFRHILIRDAAYAAMAKLERAELHEAFASWLEETSADRGAAFEETVGHHFDLAYRYRVELRDSGERSLFVARRAGPHLAAAAQAAADRGDASSAVLLFERATGLPGWDDVLRAYVLVDLSDALSEMGDPATAVGRADEALEVARRVGDRSLSARARIARLEAQLSVGSVVNPSDEATAEVDLALDDAESSSDPRALAFAWWQRSNQSYYKGNLSQSAAELDRAVEYAIHTGRESLAQRIEVDRLPVAVVSPLPASRVVAVAEEAIARFDRNLVARGQALRLLAVAEAMLGRVQDGRRHMGESLKIAKDLRRPNDEIQALFDGGWVEDLAGDPDEAIRLLHQAMDRAEAVGDVTMKAYVASRLAVILVNEGRHEEATPLLAKGDDIPTITNRVRMLSIRARLRAEAGDEQARADVAEVLHMASGLAFIVVRTDALFQSGEVMAALGDTAAARDYWQQALSLAEEKENLVVADRIRRRLAVL
jgi:class 3 adenylate cyclase/tetratricopeptide (TPR) repeat protein